MLSFLCSLYFTCTLSEMTTIKMINQSVNDLVQNRRQAILGNYGYIPVSIIEHSYASNDIFLHLTLLMLQPKYSGIPWQGQYHGCRFQPGDISNHCIVYAGDYFLSDIHSTWHGSISISFDCGCNFLNAIYWFWYIILQRSPIYSDHTPLAYANEKNVQYRYILHEKLTCYYVLS